MMSTVSPERFRTLKNTWTDRAKVVATYVNRQSGHYVHDLGCGHQKLRSHLWKKFYVGFDLVQHDHEVQVCDLEESLPTVIIGSREDRIAVACGLLEYIKDLDSFFARIASKFPMFVFTYTNAKYTRCVVEEVPLLTMQSIVALVEKYFNAWDDVGYHGGYYVIGAKQAKGKTE
jgi:hypothetical protein